jgi:O-acetyl-ADP-ribose deacetylase
MQIHLAKSDITQMAVDAVVNPANSLGIMGGGVAAALSRKGGPAIQKEAMSLAPIAVGAAVVTNAGTLFAKHVIHAPTMDQPGMKIGVENVRRATRAALLAAARNNMDVIAIPGMGTGLGGGGPSGAAPPMGGVDPSDAARAMVDELRAHRQAKPSTVYLVDIDDEILLCLEEALRLAVG